MATTLSMINPSASLEDVTPKGTRRSRLSLHLNTPKRRRWLLVQLVSIPNQATNEGRSRKAEAALEAPHKLDDYRHLVEEFQVNQFLHRAI